MLNSQLIVAALVTGSVYALIAVGLNLIYGTMRLLNVAHGEFVMAGAYVAYWAFALLGLSPLVSMLISALVLGAVGFASYKGLFRHVMRTRADAARVEANSLLVFFGISIILQSGAALLFTGNPRGYEYMDQIVHVFHASITANRLIALVVALTACLAVLAFFRFTIVGLAVRAIIENRTAARIVGINVNRMFTLTFCLGFGLAGLTGTLVSMYGQISPFMGFNYTVAGFVIIILGGLGNIFGSLIAGLILGVLETIGVAWLGANYRSILIYGVFIAVLILRPQGLFGTEGTAR